MSTKGMAIPIKTPKMFDVFTNYATDDAKELDGVKMIVGEDSHFVVARQGNRKHSRLLSSEWEKYKTELENSDPDVSDAKSDELVCAVMADTILLGWKNIMYDGKVLDYNRTNAIKLLSHKDFRRKITNFADDFNNYKLAQEKTAEEK